MTEKSTQIFPHTTIDNYFSGDRIKDWAGRSISAGTSYEVGVGYQVTSIESASTRRRKWQRKQGRPGSFSQLLQSSMLRW